MKKYPTCRRKRKMKNKDIVKGIVLCLLVASMLLPSLPFTGYSSGSYETLPKNGETYAGLRVVQINTPTTADPYDPDRWTFAYKVSWFMDEDLEVPLGRKESDDTHRLWRGVIAEPSVGGHYYTFRIVWREYDEGFLLREWIEDVSGSFNVVSSYTSLPRYGDYCAYESLTTVQINTPVLEGSGDPPPITRVTGVRWFVDEVASNTGGLPLDLVFSNYAWKKFQGTISNPSPGAHFYAFRLFWEKVQFMKPTKTWTEDTYGLFIVLEPLPTVPKDGETYLGLRNVETFTETKENIIDETITFAYDVRWFLDGGPYGGLPLSVIEQEETYKIWQRQVAEPTVGWHSYQFKIYWRKTKGGQTIDEWESTRAGSFNAQPTSVSPNIPTLAPFMRVNLVDGWFMPFGYDFFVPDVWGPTEYTALIGGFQAADDYTFPGDTRHACVDKVNITVSFPNTPPLGRTIGDVIPAGNYVAGGMFLQGQCGIARTDYGFLASLSLDHYGILQYNLAFYRTHEPVPQILWMEAEAPEYELLWSYAEPIYGIDPAEPITLSMQWDGYWVNWYYMHGGSTVYVGGCNARAWDSTIIPHFYIGEYVSWNMMACAVYCKWFQFGVYSAREVEDTGWTVKLEDPMYYPVENQWAYVNFAMDNTGEGSYLDHWWRWGGDKYEGGTANYQYNSGLERFEMEIFWRSDGTLPDHIFLWYNNPPETPSTPSGPLTGVPGQVLTYGTTAVTDPDGDDVRYLWDWGDNTIEWTSIPSASHSWSSVGTYWVKVKAGDQYGATGNWSQEIAVTITSASCPFVYSWDGQEYRFEHEAYPFAVMKNVETTSFDRLKYLKEVDGEYRLKIEQVLHEKDWADSFNLYAVDHPGEDSFVMPDLQGDLHTVKDLVQPISAYEKNGDDCLEDVKYLDDRTWKDSIFDADVNDESTLRNWVVLTFPKSEGTTEAKLMLSVKKQMTITKGWELFINLIGENYWTLWQKIMENPLLANLGMAMMEREVNLKIEVWNGTEWTWQDSFSAGASLWDDFLAVLDVSGVEGDELQVRLYFTTSDYEINYVGIDYSEDEPMTVHEIDPYYAVKNGQEDVLFALGEPDENYVTLVPNDVIELRYEAIPESEWKRDFTIATKGYYNFVDFQDQTFSGFLQGAAMWLRAMIEPYFVAKTVFPYLQQMGE